jgi:hypothetical protein
MDYRNRYTIGSDVHAWDPVHGERAVCTAPDNTAADAKTFLQEWLSEH